MSRHSCQEARSQFVNLQLNLLSPLGIRPKFCISYLWVLCHYQTMMMENLRIFPGVGCWQTDGFIPSWRYQSLLEAPSHNIISFMSCLWKCKFRFFIYCQFCKYCIVETSDGKQIPKEKYSKVFIIQLLSKWPI